MSGTSRWRAPGRVTLLGDHTDYQLGWVLPFAIEGGTTVTVELNHSSMLTATSRQLGTASPRPIVARSAGAARDSRAGTWTRYLEGAMSLLLEDGVPIPGIDIEVDGDLPLGAGLSSSASLTCATIAATLQASGCEVQRAHVAALAQRVENDFVGAPVGYMDPATVMFGQADHALLIDTRSKGVEPLACGVADHGLAFLVIDTQQGHDTAGEEYRRRVSECADAATAVGVDALRDINDAGRLQSIDDAVLMRRARHVVTENARVLTAAALLRRGAYDEVGAVMLESHESLRHDFEASTPALDVVVESAMAAGALGARMTGAGFGGSALVLTADSAAEQLIAEVQEALIRKGIQPPAVYRAAPSAGACPIDLPS